MSRPVPNGYYEMDVDELNAFINSPPPSGNVHAKIMVEIDGQRFPVIKIVRAPGHNGAVILRVPPLSEDGR